MQGGGWLDLSAVPAPVPALPNEATLGKPAGQVTTLVRWLAGWLAGWLARPAPACQGCLPLCSMPNMLPRVQTHPAHHTPPTRHHLPQRGEVLADGRHYLKDGQREMGSHQRRNAAAGGRVGAWWWVRLAGCIREEPVT